MALTQSFKIGGMSCAACSAAVERAISKVEGVEKVAVNLISGRALVEGEVEAAAVSAAVDKAGFSAEKYDGDPFAASELHEEKSIMPRRFLTALIFSIPLLIVSMGHMVGLPLPNIISPSESPAAFAATQLILTLPVLFAGRSFFIKGTKALFHFSPTMDTLVAVGSAASFIYSFIMTLSVFSGSHEAVHSLYYESAGLILTFVLLGKTLEERSKKKTNTAIGDLIKRSPKTACVESGGKEFTVNVADIAEGDVVIVRPGDAIPVDGVLLAGSAHVDESMLTGESMPVSKNESDSVFSGTVCLNGSFRFTASKAAKDSALASIVKMIDAAQSTKAPVAGFADKISGVFVPCVIAIAFIAAIIWLAVGKGLEFSLTVFVSVLVIACPCALGLATPTALTVAIGRAAKSGILIRSGEALEDSADIDTIVFDKTGTLTVGKPSVTDVISKDENHLLSVVAAAESGSSHPVAKAILEYCFARDITVGDADSFEEIGGRGIRASVSGSDIYVGNEALALENGIDISEYKSGFESLLSLGKTASFVCENGKALGVFAVSDKPRQEAHAVVSALKKMKLRVIMLSGDNKKAASAVADALTIDRVVAEVLPEEKLNVINELTGEGANIAMVGDGINDAPALTKADVGIAVSSGTDIAVSAADAVLTGGISAVPKLLLLSRKTMKVIKENLFWALIYNSLGIPIAAGVLYLVSGTLLSPMFAAAAMSLSSVSVVLNSLRLRNYRFDKS